MLDTLYVSRWLDGIICRGIEDEDELGRDFEKGLICGRSFDERTRRAKS
jgi:hypothetical protein